jgi:hypothetical protein
VHRAIEVALDRADGEDQTVGDLGVAEPCAGAGGRAAGAADAGCAFGGLDGGLEPVRRWMLVTLIVTS